MCYNASALCLRAAARQLSHQPTVHHGLRKAAVTPSKEGVDAVGKGVVVGGGGGGGGGGGINRQSWRKEGGRTKAVAGKEGKAGRGGGSKGSAERRVEEGAAETQTAQ